jgi:hypothetical protein
MADTATSVVTDTPRPPGAARPDEPEALEDLHEWVSFDLDGHTWVFDVTFLASSWTCIFLDGCPGVLTGPAPELVHGCCTYGAHFADKEDRRRTLRLAERLAPDEWQHRAEADELGGPIWKNDDGDWVTRIVDDACIFLNRTDFHTGPGCAFHQAALARGERPIDWKPTVCWQLPLRLEEHTDINSHVTYTLREWKRRDWGPGGDEFHWWCTETDEAFRGKVPVYEALRDEIIELVGAAPYERLVNHLERRGRVVFLPHPALKGRA